MRGSYGKMRAQIPFDFGFRKPAQPAPRSPVGQIAQVVQGGEQTRSLYAQNAGDENELHRLVPVFQRTVESAQVSLGFLLGLDRKGRFGQQARQRRIVLVDQHRERPVLSAEVRKQAVQGAPGRSLRRGFHAERPREMAYQTRQFVPDFRGRISLYPRHVQNQHGHARHVRQVARGRDVQPLEQVIGLASEKVRQRGYQKRFAEAARTREKHVAHARFQHALDIGGLVYVDLSVAS